MKKRIALLLLVCFTLVFLVSACSQNDATPASPDTPSSGTDNTGTGDEAPQKAIDVKIATVVAETSPLHISMLRFIEETEKKAPGRFNFLIYPNSQVGNERDIANCILLETVQGAIISDGVVSMIDPIPMTEMGNVPFLIKSIPAYYDMLDDFYGETVNKEYQSRGFINLAYYLAGGVDVGNTKRTIEKPVDLKGLKIRTWEAEGPFEFLGKCSAVPVPMAFGEVYTSLQQGAIDGVITSDFQFVSQKFTDLCKYVTSFHVFYNYQTLTFGTKWLSSLPDDLQAVLKEAGKASQDYCRDEVSVDFGQSTYQSMKDAGVTVTYLTDEQKQAFADAVADTWPDFRERIGAEIFDRVAEYMKNKE